MKKFLDTIQKNIMAATFAEAGEWDTANELTPVNKLSKEINYLNRIFMAVTFAESGIQDEVARLIDSKAVRNRGFSSKIAKDLGLHGVRLTYGTVRI